MINKVKNWTTIALLFLCLLPFASAQLTPNIWKKYIGEPVPVGTPDLIDYSYAGYKNGEEGIPENFGYTIYNVTDYGATPDDGESDTVAIRKVLDVAAVGRSIVLFPPGQYDVLLDDDEKDPFVVKGHHVIVRGSGAQGVGRGGTTIKMHNELTEGNERLFITPPVDNGWSGRPRVFGSFPSGMKYFDVHNATPLIGRQFITIRGDNLLGEDYDKLSSRPLTDLPDSYTRVKDGLKIREHHEIDRIEGNRVYIKAPLVTHLKHGMSILWENLTVGIGFEDLHIDGSFDEIYEHLVQSGRGGISLSKTAHSWIRRCRISNVIAAFSISQSYCGSAVNNIVDGRFGHNLGNIFESTYSIVAFLQDHTDRGMWHGPAVSHYSAGSVVWHVTGPLIGGPDTHGAQSRHSLFDNCSSISHHTSGGGRDSLPHHLDGYIRWNNTVLSDTTFNLWAPDHSTFTQGSLIGYKTLGGSVPRNAYFEGFGTHVAPASLYEAQLALRLGALPVWVDAYKEMHKQFVESIIIDPEQPSISPDDQDSNLDSLQGGSKIVGPWLWVLLSGQRFDETTDLLAKVSSGTVTEQKVSTTGVAAGDKVGDNVWTSAKISESGGNNINNMIDALNWEKPIQDNVIYGSIALNSPREQNTDIFYGADDGVKIWLNGNLVREDLNKWSAYNYRSNFPVTLKQGKNILLVAVDTQGGTWSGHFGFRADAEYTVLPFAGIGYAIFNDKINSGDTFTLDIYAENVADLVKWQFDIAFDSLLLEAIEVRKGYFLDSTGGVTSFQEGTINNQLGEIIGLSEVARNGNSVSGTGLLLSVTFSAKAGGETLLTLNDFQLTSGTGQAIPAGPREVALVVKHSLIWDVNGDGRVNILDLVLVAQHLGQTISVNSRADVNGDGTVNILDLVLAAQHLGESITGAAPLILAVDSINGLDPAMVQAWINQARAADDGSLTFRQGIANLERLLAALIPEETALLPNYPNPFNPETWIPYQLSQPAEVTLTIYAVNGTKVRTLALGQMPAGIYQSRSRAAYWDGKNNVGESVASGIYFYTLTAGQFTSTRKMIIRK